MFDSTAGNKQFDDSESSQKAVPLSPNNKWEAIIVFAAAVLILIAAATVVRLGLLFMSGHKTGVRKTVWILFVYYNEKFINCPITHLSTGYSRNISNYFHMGHTRKTNNLVI